MKYVSDSNLSRFLTKLKGIFAKKSEVASQADLDAKLSLSGGTMSGAIKMADGLGITLPNGSRTISNYNNDIYIGDTSSRFVYLITAANDIKHQRGNSFNTVLDTGNSQANPTLAGTEAALTSLKLNGTDYKVGGGGYAHYLSAGQGGGGLIVNNTPEAFTTETLKSWLHNNGFVDSAHYVAINIYTYYNSLFYNTLWCNGTNLRAFEINLSSGTSQAVNFPYEFTDIVVEL